MDSWNTLIKMPVSVIYFRLLVTLRFPTKKSKRKFFTGELFRKVILGSRNKDGGWKYGKRIKLIQRLVELAPVMIVPSCRCI